MFSEFLLFLDFQVLCLLGGFLSCRFGSVSKKMFCHMNEFGVRFVSDWSQWHPDGSQKGNSNTPSSPDYRSMPVCCAWRVAGGIYRVLEWVNCTKNPVLHWMLFNCCFSQSLMQAHQAVILCFVFFFFNYLRSPSSRLVLFQLSCSLMPIKTNLTKSVCFILHFFFCGRAKHHGKRL